MPIAKCPTCYNTKVGTPLYQCKNCGKHYCAKCRERMEFGTPRCPNCKHEPIFEDPTVGVIEPKP
jgi:hypothetical protein